MNYLAEIKAFYDRLELNPQPNTVIALWHALMSIANKAGWPDTFTVASSVHNFADKEHTEQLSIAERTCPICPGDILYVRETWKKAPNGYYYYEDWQRNDIADVTKWKPSIHMPKEATRIWLKVTDVRVERLQDITSEQISREGVEVEYPHVLNGEEKRYAFSTLWNSTIKKSDLNRYGWDANPWVWVIEFERCEKPEIES